jgi:hypothetical protein
MSNAPVIGSPEWRRSLRRRLGEYNKKLPPISEKQKQENRKLPPEIPYSACAICFERGKEFVVKEGPTLDHRILAMYGHIFQAHTDELVRMVRE